MSTTQIIVLVAGILALQVAIWIPVIAWLRRRSAKLTEALRAELEAAEGIVLGPHAAMYRGASDGSKIKGNAVAVLSPERLIITKVTGDRVEVPLAELTGVREDKWFLRSAKGGLVHIIVARGDGELGFYVDRHDDWVAALRARVGQAGD